MSALFEYLFWTSGYILALGFLYHFLIKPKCSPGFGRLFILGGLLVSLILGLGFFPGPMSISEQGSGVIILPEVVVYASGNIEESRLLIQDFLFTSEGFVYLSLIVSMLIFLRLAFSLVYIASRWRVLKGRIINGMLVIPTKTDRSPFSFFRLVFVPERLLTDPALDKILLHEKAHVRMLHSLDLVFVEALSVFFWFHPAIWYLRRQLKQQHEFEADRYVLGQMVDKAAYQQLMINYPFQGYHWPITNPFNVSPLKKRIMMMNQPSRKPVLGNLFGIAATVVLFAGITMLQTAALKAIGPMENKISDVQTVSNVELTIAEAASQAPVRRREPVRHQDDETLYVVVEELPQFPGGEEARMSFIRDNVVYPTEARDAGIQGTVFVTFVIEKDGSISDPRIIRGIGYGCDEEVLRVVGAMPNWIPGRNRGQPVRVQFTMPFRFALDENSRKPAPAPTDEPARITRIEGFGYINGKRFKIDLESLGLRSEPRTVEPVIFIDGKKVDAELANLDEIIPLAEIDSIRVFKGEKARRIYQHDNVLSISTRRARIE
jgi:TonB family protein